MNSFKNTEHDLFVFITCGLNNTDLVKKIFFSKIYLLLPFFKNFLFYFGVWPINNVVIVSGGQQRHSAMHIHASILPQTPLPSRLPPSIELSSMCYIQLSLLFIHFKYSSVYMLISNSLTISYSYSYSSSFF